VTTYSATDVVTYDPYDYATQDDPYPTYAWLRENAPLYHNEEYGFWALSRHADLLAAFRDETIFSNQMGVSVDPASWGPQARYAMSFLAMDPPEQTRLRSLVSRGFTPRRVQQLEPRIRTLTCEYLDAIPDGTTFDFIDEFAGKLPMDVISELMGVPTADRAELRRLADLLVHRPPGARDVPQAGVDAALTLLGFFGEMIADRRRAPKDDLVSALVAADLDGDHLADSEVIGFALLMIVAGNETTTKLLGNSIYWAAQNPDQLASVFTDPARVPLWVNETLRYDASTQLLARYLTADVELHGEVAPAGAQLVLLLGAANRDPAVFDDPDRYDLDRDTSALISFGGGRHYCLGANLARLEASIALDELIARATDIEVDETAGIERVHSVNVRGFAHLPVRIGRRA
jgi:cytochrome P450